MKNQFRWQFASKVEIQIHQSVQPLSGKSAGTQNKSPQRPKGPDDPGFQTQLIKIGDVVSDPLTDPVAAVSCGIYAGQLVLDLDYPEDSEAGVDGNFIMTGSYQLIEVQMSAEGSTYTRDQMNQLMDLAEKGVSELAAIQKAATA